VTPRRGAIWGFSSPAVRLVTQSVLLGSGGWIPTSRRETCSALIRRGAEALVLDAGTGIRHLVERPELLSGAENVDIVLTHFHLDHVVGLSYLPALQLRERPTIWGGGKLLAGTSTRLLLDRLLAPPLFSAPFDAIAGALREIHTGAFEVGGIAVEARVQARHAEPDAGPANGGCADVLHGHRRRSR
jgi:ribonuclease BN (tRNA processing enzyme)